LQAVALSADGTYQILVQAGPGHTANTGSYLLSVWDATVHTYALNLNENSLGQLTSAYAVDNWMFSVATNQQVRFNLLGTQTPGFLFDLTGPNGYTAFSGVSSSSSLITVPNSGNYTLTVHATQPAQGSYSFQMQLTSVTPIINGAPYNGVLTGSGQAQLFTVSVPQDEQLLLKLQSQSGGDPLEVYASFGTPPTPDTYQYASTEPLSLTQTIVAPTAAPGTWYILVYAPVVSLTTENYTLTGTSSAIGVKSIMPTRLGNAADAVLTLTGAGFDNTTTVSLVAGNGTVYQANQTQLDLPTQLTATFTAGTVPAGVYSVVATQGDGTSATLSNALTMDQGGASNFHANLVTPSTLGYHVAATFYLQYSNTGDLAMPAPLIKVTITQSHANGVSDQNALLTLDASIATQGIWSSTIPPGFSNSIEVLATGVVPGVLEPGESFQVPIYWAGWQPPYDFLYPPFQPEISVETNSDTTPIPWSTIQANFQPPSVSTAAWNAMFPNLEAQIGSSWGAFVQRLDNDASYLGHLGENVSDLSQLWQLELQQAAGFSPVQTLSTAVDASLPTPGPALTVDRTLPNSIAARNEKGPFGMGWQWTDGWQRALSIDSYGTVTISNPAGDADGAPRMFVPNTRGGYFSEPGDEGTLTAVSGGFQLEESDGGITAFGSSGFINYVQDTNGTRVNANYTHGLLTSLTATTGQGLSFAYNAAGLMSSVTDSTGRTTTYTYDPSNTYLIAVTGYAGRTIHYTYDTGNVPSTANALLSVQTPDGTVGHFTYDIEGRLSQTDVDDGSGTSPTTMQVTFTYGPAGEVSATDATGAVTRYFADARWMFVKIVDPLGNATHFSYDGDYNRTQIIDPAGHVINFAYDQNRNLLRVMGANGDVVSATYSGPFNKITSSTDANGNTSTYAYGSQGNLLSITYPNGTTHQFSYDPVGNLTESINARGQAIQNTYNGMGQLTRKTFADGTYYAYIYDAHGNLISATDGVDATTFQYDPVTEDLVQVTYPGGQFLRFTYDSAGRRIQSTDQDGFTVKYLYKRGMLVGLTDGSNNSIVSYTYDAAGRLIRKDMGNSTYATYQYDQDGDILHLINYAPNGSVNSRFDYTYDSLGNIRTMNTLDGVWTYQYDPDGHLTQAVFTSSNMSAVPNEDLLYQYDLAGNWTQTITNGATTTYLVNDMNQYTEIGSTIVTYDADGNQISRTDNSGTTGYTYNELNRLVGVVSAGSSSSFEYDPLGDLTSVTENGQTTRYIIDPSGWGNIVGEYNGGVTGIAKYTYGLGLTSRIDAGGQTAYYDFDRIGSTVGMSGANGSYINVYRYLPFGALLTSSTGVLNPFEFVGQFGVMAQVNGLDFMRARVYVPSQGTFLTRDPLGLGAGQTNPYEYAAQNPVRFVDPGGLCYSESVIKARAAAVAAAQADVNAAEETLKNAKDLVLWASTAAGDAASAAVTASAAAAYAAWAAAAGALTPAGPELALVAAAAEALATAAEAAAAAASLFLEAAIATELAAAATYTAAVAYLGIVEADLALAEADPCPVPPPPPPPEPPTQPCPVDYDGGLPSGGVPENVTVDCPPDPHSKDPNAKTGPTGYGTQGFIPLDSVLPYRINFENDPTATAPAQRVVITDALDPNIDLSTLQFTEVGFGDNLVTIPAGSQQFQTTLTMTYNGLTFEVLIELALNASTGLITATFQSVDPTTQLPPPILIGFLPPEDGTGRGMGFFSYNALPKAGLVTGSQIRNIATVVFDNNAAITTDQVNENDPSQGVDPSKQCVNTIDAVAPTSSVTTLPAFSPGSFSVQWSGQDDLGGSGIGSFNVYVSDNGGAFTLWQSDTSSTTATFTGVDGHTYGFYSIAFDNAGNAERIPAGPEATTKVDATAPISSVAALPAFSPATFGLTWSGNDGSGSGIATYSLYVSDNGGAFGLLLGNTTLTSTGFTGQVGHSYGFYSVATDNVGNRQVTPSQAQATTSVDSPTAVALTSDHLLGSVYGQSVTITATVTANSTAAGTPTGTLQFQVDGVNLGAPITLQSGVATLAGVPFVAGSHNITASYVSNNLGLFADGASASTLVQSVGQAPLTITGDNQSKIYGAANPTLTFTLSGFVNGDTVSVVSGSPTLTTAAASGSGVGSYPITVVNAGSLSAANYDFPAANFVNGTLTVTPATPAFSGLNSPSIIYGTATDTITGHVSAGSLFPTGTVTITLNGVTQNPTIDSKGNFTSTFDTSLLPVASYTVTYHYAGDHNFNAVSPDGTSPLTVSKVTPATVVVTPNPQQYSDLVTFTATLSPFMVDGNAAATSVTFFVGSQNMGTVSQGQAGWSVSGNVLTATLPNISLLEPSPFGNAPTGQMAPGAHTVTAQFGGVDTTHFTIPNPTTTLTVTQENATATYTGDLFVFAPSVSSSSAAVTLRATIQDPPTSATDPFRGDIRNATVTFVDRGNNNAVLGTANLPVSLINASDNTTGSVAESVSLPINITTGSTQYTIGIIVNNYYTDNNSAEDTVVTVSQPIGTGSITGGGYLVANASSGTYAATAVTKENFGFNVKFNKSGTNLQGGFNAIVRQNGHDYQIKSNSMSSLGIYGTTQNQAQFDAKANLTDITNPNSTISLYGNLALHVTMTDNGDPGNWTSPDTIGITLWNGSTLLFSSNWSGANTVEQAIAAGNLVVHHAQLVAGGPAQGPGSSQVLTQQMLQPVVLEAIALWQAAGVPAAALANLKNTPIIIRDLPGAYVGRESADDVIIIDANAAGYGWYIDPNPADFAGFPASFNRSDVGHVDLLTVVAHELGHVLGIAELDNPNDVMFEYLPVGKRKIPTAADVLAAGLVPVQTARMAGQPNWIDETSGLAGHQAEAIWPYLDMGRDIMPINDNSLAVPELPTAKSTPTELAAMLPGTRPSPIVSLPPAFALAHRQAIDLLLGQLPSLPLKNALFVRSGWDSLDHA
jgi:RHS repeat-associated protein